MIIITTGDAAPSWRSLRSTQRDKGAPSPVPWTNQHPEGTEVSPQSCWLSFIDSSSSCRSRCQMIPATFDKAQESAGQLANAVRLAKPYGFVGDQFAAYAECDGPSEYEFGSVLLIHAP